MSAKTDPKFEKILDCAFIVAHGEGGDVTVAIDSVLKKPGERVFKTEKTGHCFSGYSPLHFSRVGLPHDDRDEKVVVFSRRQAAQTYLGRLKGELKFYFGKAKKAENEVDIERYQGGLNAVNFALRILRDHMRLESKSESKWNPEVFERSRILLNQPDYGFCLEG